MFVFTVVPAVGLGGGATPGVDTGVGDGLTTSVAVHVQHP